MSFQTTRRSFVIASGLTALASTRVLGANDTLRVGVIGAGGRMDNLLDSIETVALIQYVAVSDVYKPHRDKVVERAAKLGSAAPTTHLEYKEVLDQQLDAVIIASPDHWHVKMASDAIAAGKDVYLEKPVTHTLEEGAVLTKAVRSSKQILQCGMQQRSWSHFKNAVSLIQGGSLGKVVQVRTYWWQNYQSHFTKGSQSWTSSDRPVEVENLDWKLWLGNAPDQPFSKEKFFHWRWFWNFGGGAMTDLFTHWIDVVHWAMQSDTPSKAMMLGDKYIFEQWDCPDTVQAALRYPKGEGKNQFDVVYEGMMASSIDDGGLEFRGTEATLKLTRSGFSIYKEGLNGKENPILAETSFRDGTIEHMQNFVDCLKSRQQPNAPVEAGVSAARAGHIANLAYHGNGQTNWPAKS
jgi:predicted dehydrogenase